MFTKSITFCLLSLFLLFSGCVVRNSKHGYVFDGNYTESSIRVGDKMNKILKNMGEPSLKSKDGKRFYYVSYLVKRTNPLGQRVVSSDVLELIFDKSNSLLKKKVIKLPDHFTLKTKYVGILPTGINDSALRSLLKFTYKFEDKVI